MVLAFFILPGSLNQSVSEEEMESMESVLGRDEEWKFKRGQPVPHSKSASSKHNITWCKVLTNKNVIFTMLVIWTGTYCTTFYLSLIAKHFQDLQFNDSGAAMAITIANVAYIVGMLSLPLLCKKIPRRLIFVLAMLGFTLTNFLLGPSDILGLPFVTWPVFLSFFLQGIFMVLIYVPSIPEMTERLYYDFDVDVTRDTETVNQINDKVNDVYALSIATSAMISPFIGSRLNQHFSAGISE